MNSDDEEVSATTSGTESTSPSDSEIPEDLLAESDIPTSDHWNAEEKALLLASMKQFGILNVEYLASILKTKNAHQIRAFFLKVTRSVQLDRRNKAIKNTRLKMAKQTKFRNPTRITPKNLKQAPTRQLWYKMLASELGRGPLDWWLNLTEEYMKTNSESSYMVAEMIPRAFAIIAQYEDHPPPSECGGVDFREAYDYLYHVLSGVPPRAMQPATAQFLKRSIKKLLNSVKDAMFAPICNKQYGEQVNHLMQLSTENIKTPAHTYVMNEKNICSSEGLLNSSQAMTRLINSNSFNPFKFSERMTWKPNHLLAMRHLLPDSMAKETITDRRNAVICKICNKPRRK